MTDVDEHFVQEVWARLGALETWQKVHTLLLGLIAGKLGLDLTGVM
jgi:hypothetical protein